MFYAEEFYKGIANSPFSPETVGMVVTGNLIKLTDGRLIMQGKYIFLTKLEPFRIPDLFLLLIVILEQTIENVCVNKSNWFLYAIFILKWKQKTEKSKSKRILEKCACSRETGSISTGGNERNITWHESYLHCTANGNNEHQWLEHAGTYVLLWGRLFDYRHDLTGLRGTGSNGA